VIDAEARDPRLSERNWCDVRKAGRTSGVSEPVTYDPDWRRRRWHRLSPADKPGRTLPVSGNVAGRFSREIRDSGDDAALEGRGAAGARGCQEPANLVGQVGRPQTMPPGACARQVGAEPDRAPAGAVGGVSAVARVAGAVTRDAPGGGSSGRLRRFVMLSDRERETLDEVRHQFVTEDWRSAVPPAGVRSCG